MRYKYPKMIYSWHSYTLPKEDPKKYINHVRHHLSSAKISIFLWNLPIFIKSVNKDKSYTFTHSL